jgi:hypothetical protein
VQQSLTLFFTAVQIAWRAILFYLGDVSGHSTPAFDLPFIVRASSSHVITAVPLKPAAWIFGIDPSFFSPIPKRFGGVHSKKIQLGIVFLRVKPGVLKPIRGEFRNAISEILSPEHAHFEHFFRSKVRLEIWMKILPDRFRQPVFVPLLHQIVHDNQTRFHNNGIIQSLNIQ